MSEIVDVYKGNHVYRGAHRPMLRLDSVRWIATCTLCEWDTGGVHLIDRDHAEEVARNHVRVVHPEQIVENLAAQEGFTMGAEPGTV